MYSASIASFHRFGPPLGWVGVAQVAGHARLVRAACPADVVLCRGGPHTGRCVGPDRYVSPDPARRVARGISSSGGPCMSPSSRVAPRARLNIIRLLVAVGLVLGVALAGQVAHPPLAF